VLANSWNQERTLAQLDEDDRGKTRAPVAQQQPLQRFRLIPTKGGYIEFSTRMLERKTIAHSTMSQRPAKSVLDGALNVTQSAEVANEMLNDMQRERGGGVVEEDVSRYAVGLRGSGSADSWTGEVIGEPSLLPLETVNVLSANKSIVVFDKNNKKLWQATLNFNLSPDSVERDLDSAANHGPCIEQKDTLYGFDAGMLSAFDLKTGNARWRLPSVGVTGIYFDDQGMLYVNTTTGSPDQIKFSHQIDINRKVVSIVLKVAPSNGRILWSSQTGGLVNYVSGKYIYTVQSYEPEEEDDTYRPETGFEIQPHMRIKRLNPKNGRAMWEHFQQRAPLDVQFDKNRIRLMFKKEIQVLRCMSW
jgi:outer membrane protein assembly factor BamB